MDWDVGSIENLARRIIRSVQEPSADLRWPTTVTAKANSLTRRQKQITHGKIKANSLTAKADGSRQKQIGKL